MTSNETRTQCAILDECIDRLRGLPPGSLPWMAKVLRDATVALHSAPVRGEHT